jgi:transcriptional regulator with GAF, ATPase, and Fis domain
MRKLMSQLHTLARSDVAVLICGETGTGKEFMARFIHRHSPRRMHNFVKVNCPALSPTLFESELFGHAKGAFTGAYNGRIGRFELANKGSIFLDEIGDLDISLQAKLLHVLQDSKLERVGESASIHIDVRCISATNADLHQQMRTHRFRRDLFYRLGLVTVQAPSLRDRQEELEPMLFHLMRLYAEDRQCVPVELHPDALAVLKSYHWPGNIRELGNLVARLLILHPGGRIGPEHVVPLLEQGEAVELGTRAAAPSMPAHTENFRQEVSALTAVEKNHIERMLIHANGRVGGDGGAAQLLGLPRSTLQYKLKKHGIHPKMFRRKIR